jgi:protein-S-isoprenylcysteine O-methyltransferase Ste14
VCSSETLFLAINAALCRTTAVTPPYIYAILAAGWVLWVVPFFLVRRKRTETNRIDKRARWGIVITGVGYALLWQGKFWLRLPQLWQIALSTLLFAIAALISWTALRALGRQWRLDAGLSADHELVMAGPYRFVRHPIYASMFCVLLGTGFLMTPWWLFVPAIILFVMGTEIRVRIEDKLLAARFGDSHTEYRRRISAYIPFLR